MKKFLNKAHLGDVVIQGDGLQYPRKAKVFIGDAKEGYEKGDLLDANAVSEVVGDIIGAAPEALDTIKELAEAIGDDADFINTINNKVDNEVSRAVDAEQDLSDAIDAESDRAIAAEESIQSRLTLNTNSLSDQISAEQTRATAVEQQLDTALQTETSNRTAADQALSGRIDQIIIDSGQSVTGETTRARAAEEALDSKIDQEITDRQTAVTNEATARQNADTTLQDNIDAEQTRAEGAEEALDQAKADKATTLSGYNITDAYTKSETDDLLDEKQDNIADLATIRSGASAGSTAYQKPASGIPSADMATAVQSLLDAASTALQPANLDTLNGKVAALEALVSEDSDPTAAIDKFNEIVAFLEGITNTETLEGIIGGIGSSISAVQDQLTLNTSVLSEQIDAKYTKPNTGVPYSDLSSDVQGSLGLADSAVQDNDYVHTDNNYTTAEKQKLSGIAANAQVNILEGVQVNGSDLQITDKKVDVTIPTTLSDLSDDSTHRLVTDAEKSTWNGKQDAIECATDSDIEAIFA